MPPVVPENPSWGYGLVLIINDATLMKYVFFVNRYT